MYKCQFRKPSFSSIAHNFCLVALSLTISFTHAQDTETTASEAIVDNPLADRTDIEEIVVTGRAQRFYKLEDTTIGLRGGADLLDIAQSVQLISRELIDDQAVQKVTDLYRNVSGLSEFSYSGVTFRGFRQDEVRYDGLKGDPFIGFSVPRLFDIERVEFLKGVAGAAYGGGEPGGLINFVTKSPTDIREAEVALRGGNFDLFGVDATLSGALNGGDSLRGGVGISYEESNPFRFNQASEDLFFTGDLAYDFTDRTTGTLKLDYFEQDLQGARLRGVVVDDAGNFLTDREFNTNEATDFQRLDSLSVSTRLTHQFSESISLSAALRYVDTLEDQNYHESRGFTDAEGNFIGNSIQTADESIFVQREFRDQLRDTQQFAGFIDVNFEFATGLLDHNLLVGTEAFRQETDNQFFTADPVNRAADIDIENGISNVPSINLLNPVFGLSNPSVFDFDRETISSGEFSNFAFYFQDQISIGERWIVSLGGRYENFEDESSSATRNPFQGQEFPDPTSQSSDDAAFTFRSGVIYKPLDNLSVYGVFSEGFEPQPTSANTDSENGGPFDPERSNLLEVGMKWDALDGAISIQASLYQIEKKDLLTDDPNFDGALGRLITLGEVESQGFEVDVIGDITDRWVFTFNYAYNDAEVVDGVDLGINTNNLASGGDFANSPDNQFSVWSRYELPFWRSSVAGGVNFVDEQVSFNDQIVQSYTLFDIAWSTSISENLGFQINVRNLFDEEFAVSGFNNRNGHFPGTPREIIGEISYSF